MRRGRRRVGWWRRRGGEHPGVHTRQHQDKRGARHQSNHSATQTEHKPSPSLAHGCTSELASEDPDLLATVVRMDRLSTIFYDRQPATLLLITRVPEPPVGIRLSPSPGGTRGTRRTHRGCSAVAAPPLVRASCPRRGPRLRRRAHRAPRRDGHHLGQLRTSAANAEASRTLPPITPRCRVRRCADGGSLHRQATRRRTRRRRDGSPRSRGHRSEPPSVPRSLDRARHRWPLAAPKAAGRRLRVPVAVSQRAKLPTPDKPGCLQCAGC